MESFNLRKLSLTKYTKHVVWNKKRAWAGINFIRMWRANFNTLIK